MLLCLQLKKFTKEQAKINKDIVTKFKAVDKAMENIEALEDIDSKVTEVKSSNH
jgi:hypothetical protein